jgi:hypothetical protein
VEVGRAGAPPGVPGTPDALLLGNGESLETMTEWQAGQYAPPAGAGNSEAALRRLAARVGALRLQLETSRERLARVRSVEAAAGIWQRLPTADRAEVRAAGWELQRLRAELALAREEFERLRAH